MSMHAGPLVIVIDDEEIVRRSIRALLEPRAFRVREYAKAEAFLVEGALHRDTCLVVDMKLPGMDGLELQDELRRRKLHIPLILMTGFADVPLAVKAIKAGASDFLQKPFDKDALLLSIGRAIDEARKPVLCTNAETAKTARLLSRLTQREREVLEHLSWGESNKAIGYKLGISTRTVEIFRSNLYRKLGAHSLADLIRIVRAAGVLS